MDPAQHEQPPPEAGVATIIPYREPGKSRLSATSRAPTGPAPHAGLDAEQRTLLGRAMLADVITALRGAGIDDLLVAAGDRRAGEVATMLGVRSVVDRVPDGLSSAVDAACGEVDADAVLVVAADLPALTAAEVGMLLARDTEVVVAPTRRAGTGGLLRRPPLAIAASYGPGSAQRHIASAHAASRSVATFDLPGFRDDVDTVEDLVALPPERLGSRTRDALQRIGWLIPHEPSGRSRRSRRVRTR
jgi:2-phospho-L-lactate guanylyltransferase